MTLILKDIIYTFLPLINGVKIIVLNSYNLELNNKKDNFCM
jgi:hypothetical protein